jgi:hypothetical protein
VLLAIVDDTRAANRDRIAAGREILDRGYGRAPEHAPVDGADPLELGPIQVAIAALVADLRLSLEAAVPDTSDNGTPVQLGELTTAAGGTAPAELHPG